MFFQIFLLIASIAYQSYRADQMRKQMRAREEAMKGMEITVRGHPGPLPVCYGHAVSRGVQVYYKTSKTYTKADDVTSETSSLFVQAPNEAYYYINYGLGADESDTYSIYLFVDQAICAESLTEVLTCSVDDMAVNVDELRYGIAMEVQHLPPVPNDPDPNSRQLPLRTLNLPLRDKAWFAGAVNACMVFKLNRNDPQYGGAPDVAFLVKGKKVRKIEYLGSDSRIIDYLNAPTPSNYTRFLEAAKDITPDQVAFGDSVYSNNSALVLADYLTQCQHGKQLSDDKLDLVSFFKAKCVCDLQIKNYITDPGPFNDSDRVLSLFSADVSLDTSVSVRDNIRKIKDTMPGAEMPWSDGKYKLNLSFPFKEEHLPLLSVMTITDDQIIDSRISTIYPGKNDRMNSCKVSFLNEAMGGVQDYIVWPPESSEVYKKYLEQDGGLPISKNIQIDDVTHPVHAKLIAMREVTRSRKLRFHKLTTTIEGFILEPGDIVELKSQKIRYDGSSVYCRVKEISYADTATGLSATLDMEEVNYEANVIDAEAQDLATPGIKPIPPMYAFLSGSEVWVGLIPGNAVNDFNVYNRNTILHPATGDLYHRAYTAGGVSENDDEEFTIIPVAYHGAETKDVRHLVARREVAGVAAKLGSDGNASASTMAEIVVPERTSIQALRAVVWGSDKPMQVGYEVTLLAEAQGSINFSRDGKIVKRVPIHEGENTYTGKFQVGNNTTDHKTIGVDVSAESGQVVVKSARMTVRS